MCKALYEFDDDANTVPIIFYLNMIEFITLGF